MPHVVGHQESDTTVPVASRVVGANTRRSQLNSTNAPHVSATVLGSLRSQNGVGSEAGAAENPFQRRELSPRISDETQGSNQGEGTGARASTAQGARGAQSADRVDSVAGARNASTSAPAPAPQISSGLSLSQLRTPPRSAHNARAHHANTNANAVAKGDSTSSIWRSHSTSTLGGGGGLAFDLGAAAAGSSSRGDHRSSSAHLQRGPLGGASVSASASTHTYYRSTKYSTVAAAASASTGAGPGRGAGAGGAFARPPPRFSSYSLSHDSDMMTTPKSGAQGDGSNQSLTHLLPENLLDTPAPKSRSDANTKCKGGEVTPAPAGAAASAAGEGGEGQKPQHATKLGVAKPLVPAVVAADGGAGERPTAASGAASELGQLNGPASFGDFFEGTSGDGPSYQRSRASSNELSTGNSTEGSSRSSPMRTASSSTSLSATAAAAAAGGGNIPGGSATAAGQCQSASRNIRVAANDPLSALREHESPTAAAARAHLHMQQHRRVSSASGGSGSASVAEQKVDISPIFGPQNGYHGYLDYADEQGGRGGGGVEGRRGSQYEAQIMAEMRHREREHMRKYAAAAHAAAAAGSGGGAYDDRAAAGRYASGGRHGGVGYPDYPNASGGVRPGSRSVEAREREAHAYQKLRQLQHAKMLQNAQRNEKQRFHTQTLPRREREMLQAAYYQQQGERERAHRAGDEHPRGRVHMSAVEKVYVLEQKCNELKLRLQNAERRAVDMQTHVKLREQESEQRKQENRVLGDERDALLEQVTGLRMQSRRAKEANAALLERAHAFEKKCDWYRAAYSKLQAEQMKKKHAATIRSDMTTEGVARGVKTHPNHVGMGPVGTNTLGHHRERTAPFPGSTGANNHGGLGHRRMRTAPFPGAGAGTFRHTHEPPRSQMRGGPLHIGPGGGGLRVSVSNANSPRQVPPGKDGLRANVAAWTPKNAQGAKNSPQNQAATGGGTPVAAATTVVAAAVVTESKEAKDARENFKKAFEEFMPKDPRAELKSAVEKRVKEEEVSSGTSSPVKGDEEGKKMVPAQLSSNAKEFVPNFGS